MKKLISILFILILCFSLTACFRWLTPPEHGPAPGTGGDPEPSGGDPEPASPAFDFTTTDLEGNSISLSDYADCKLILVNLWEPWCGPCLGEMPDLQKLYEKYRDQGFVILGVFGYDTDDNAKQAVSDTGVTYPILHSSSEFAGIETGYVPTSVFLDAAGNRLNKDDLIGSMSYEDWEKLILEYLK